MCAQGPLIVTEELHSLSFESELHLNQSGLNVKLEVRKRCISMQAPYSKGFLWAVASVLQVSDQLCQGGRDMRDLQPKSLLIDSMTLSLNYYNVYFMIVFLI